LTDRASPTRSQRATPDPAGEPAARFDAVTARHHIEELPAADVDDLGRPELAAEPADPGEQCLVQAERVDLADAVGVIDQLLTHGNDSVPHRMPAASEIAGDVADSAAMTADLCRHPARSAYRQPAARRCDLGIVVAPAASTAGTPPALLTPQQPYRPTQARQIDQCDLADTMAMHHHNTRTRRPLTLKRDYDPQPQRPVAVANHDHIGQADHQRAHARSIGFQAGPLETRRLQTSLRIAEPLCRARDPPQITQPSNAESPQSAFRDGSQ
jgi:hypothetical protein